jgi:hypothetical protein
MDKDCNVFISHIHEDDARLAELKDLIAQHGCTVRDSSVNSNTPNNANDPEYIKREILAPRINWASVLIVLVSPGTRNSPYVQWEIEYAQKQGKRIIGVWDHGSADCDIPEGLRDFASAVVGWQGERVVDAIFGRIANWEQPSGEVRPNQLTQRHNC